LNHLGVTQRADHVTLVALKQSHGRLDSVQADRALDPHLGKAGRGDGPPQSGTSPGLWCVQGRSGEKGRNFVSLACVTASSRLDIPIISKSRRVGPAESVRSDWADPHRRTGDGCGTFRSRLLACRCQVDDVCVCYNFNAETSTPRQKTEASKLAVWDEKKNSVGWLGCTVICCIQPGDWSSLEPRRRTIWQPSLGGAELPITKFFVDIRVLHTKPQVLQHNFMAGFLGIEAKEGTNVRGCRSPLSSWVDLQAE